MASRLRSYQKRKSLRMIVGAVVIIGFVLVTGLGMLRLFTIRKVEVEGAGLRVEVDRKRLGNFLLSVPIESIREELLESYPLLETVWFEKRLPGTLVIHLVKRQPYCIVRSSNVSYLVGKEGVVLDNAHGSEPYPVLYIDLGPFAIGTRIADKRVVQSLAFLRALPSTYVIQRITERDVDTLQVTMEQTTIFLPQEGDMRAKAHTLQTIVDGFRIKGTLPSVIDLRFEKPVITN